MAADVYRNNTMHSVERLTIAQLLWRKTWGCYQTFGIWETLRRIDKELKRFSKSNNAALDISWVTSTLAIGAAPRSLSAILQLTDFKISSVLDMRTERKKTDILSDGFDMDVRWVPVYDDWKPKPPALFREIADVIRGIGDDGKLFICCGAGEHRAPLGGIIALMIEGYTLDRAIQLIQRARPVAEILPVYRASLVTFINEQNGVF